MDFMISEILIIFFCNKSCSCGRSRLFYQNLTINDGIFAENFVCVLQDALHKKEAIQVNSLFFNKM